MKTSNIILSTVVSSITLMIIFGALDMRLNGSGQLEWAVKEIKLSPFRYLIIRDAENIRVSSSDKSNIVIRHVPYEEEAEVRFREKGDTLIIDYLTPKSWDKIAVHLHTSEDLEWIKADNSSVRLFNLLTKQLAIDLKHSWLNIGEEVRNAGTLDIAGGNNSSITVGGARIDTLILHLNDSQASIHAKVDKLKGAMTSHSSLFARDVSNFEFSKDSTSRMH